MREWIERLSAVGGNGLAMSVSMLSSVEHWTLKPDDFTEEAAGLFESVMDRVRESTPEFGGIRGGLLLRQLAYAPPLMRLPTLVMLAREWPEGLDRLLSGQPQDKTTRLYRHNAVASLVTLVAHAEQAVIFHPDRVDRVAAAIKRRRSAK